MGKSNVRWFLYTQDSPDFPTLWKNGKLLCFNTEDDAWNFINALAQLWDDPHLPGWVYPVRRITKWVNEENVCNATNLCPKYIEVRYNEEDEWHDEIHLFNKDTDAFVL